MVDAEVSGAPAAASAAPTLTLRQHGEAVTATTFREGGEPGGNIRVAFLFRTDRGVQFVDRGEATSTTPASVYTDADGDAHLTTSPARVAPDSPAWDGSRVPLVGEFVWNDKTFFVVANHFGSKGGDDPLFGRWQPAERSSEVKRHQQAREVRAFVDELLAPSSALGRTVARGESEPTAPLRQEDAGELRGQWDEVVTQISGALVFRH